MSYSPDFELLTSASKTLKNKNTQEHVDRILKTILNNVMMIKN